MSAVSFGVSSPTLDPNASDLAFREKSPSQHMGDVFTIPSVKSGSATDTKSESVTETVLDKNPFKIPSDIDIFLLRDKQKEKARLEREKRKTLKVHEKMTCSAMIGAKQSGFKRQIQLEEEAEDKEFAAEAERLKALRESISWKIAVTKDQVVERETMYDYINQKRQLFLLQYAVTVKKDEILKLEKLAVEEEAKLEKAEEDLEKDAGMFDEFLKENDRNSAQALKTAEKETKAKLEKIIEIRELTAQMMNIQSEIARFEDTLQEYMVFKDFLFQLSPKEWQENYERKRQKEKVLKVVPDTKDEKLPNVAPSTSRGRDQQSKTKQKATHSNADLLPSEQIISRSPSISQPRKDSSRLSRIVSRQNLKSQQSRKMSTLSTSADDKENISLSDEEDDEVKSCSGGQRNFGPESMDFNYMRKVQANPFGKKETCQGTMKLE